MKMGSNLQNKLRKQKEERRQRENLRQRELQKRRRDANPERYNRQSVLQKKWRKIIFQRDNYKCRYCGDGSDLDLAHITPRANFAEVEMSYSDDNLVTLCKECHKCFHSKRTSVHRVYRYSEMEVLDKRWGVIRKFRLMKIIVCRELLKLRGLVDDEDWLTKEDIEHWNNEFSKMIGLDQLTKKELKIIGDGLTEKELDIIEEGTALIVAAEKDTEMRRRGVKRLFYKLKKGEG